MIEVLDLSHAEKLCAAWALAWFWQRHYEKNFDRSLSQDLMHRLFVLFLQEDHPYVLRCLADILSFTFTKPSQYNNNDKADYILEWAVAADTGELVTLSMVPDQQPFPEDVQTKMLKLLEHPERKMREGIAICLSRVGLCNNLSVNTLFEVMNSSIVSHSTRDEAVEGLVRVSSEPIINRLVSQLELTDEYIPVRSMLALIAINTRKTLDGFCIKLSSTNSNARYLSAAGLAVFVKNGDDKAIKFLEQALDVETEDQVIKEVKRVLMLSPTLSEGPSSDSSIAPDSD